MKQILSEIGHDCSEQILKFYTVKIMDVNIVKVTMYIYFFSKINYTLDTSYQDIYDIIKAEITA